MIALILLFAAFALYALSLYGTEITRVFTGPDSPLDGFELGTLGPSPGSVLGGWPDVIVPVFDLRSAIRYQASITRLPADFIWGVVQTESSGNPNAQNPADPSAGLMGVTPLIGRAYGGLTGNAQEVLNKLLDAATNLAIGSAYLGYLWRRYSSLHSDWIQSYNVGETKFDRGIRNPAYQAAWERNRQGWTG